jgi:drug/metabolite transporter (DMT)-like permease
MWFWLAATSGLASAMEMDKVFQRLAMKGRGNALAHSFLYISLMAIFSSLFSFPMKISYEKEFFILLFLQAAFWSVGTILNFWSHSKTDVSLSMIISRARIIWMIPLGFLFLNEHLSAISIFGMLIIFSGLAVLFVKDKLHFHPGIHLMTLSSVFVALGSIVNVLLLHSYLSPTQVTFTTMFGQSIVFLIFLLFRGNISSRIPEVLGRAWHVIIIAAIIETFAFIVSSNAYKLGTASAVNAVYLGMTVTTVWVGIIFLGERTNIRRKLISSAIVTLGIIIVKIFN